MREEKEGGIRGGGKGAAVGLLFSSQKIRSIRITPSDKSTLHYSLHFPNDPHKINAITDLRWLSLCLIHSSN